MLCWLYLEEFISFLIKYNFTLTAKRDSLITGANLEEDQTLKGGDFCWWTYREREIDQGGEERRGAELLSSILKTHQHSHNNLFTEVLLSLLKTLIIQRVIQWQWFSSLWSQTKSLWPHHVYVILKQISWQHCPRADISVTVQFSGHFLLPLFYYCYSAQQQFYAKLHVNL